MSIVSKKDAVEIDQPYFPPITRDECMGLFSDLLFVHATMDAVYATFAAENLTVMDNESIVALMSAGMERVMAMKKIVDRPAMAGGS